MGLLVKCDAVDSPYGVELDAAYLRVRNVTASAVNTVAYLEMYASLKARETGASPIRRWGVSVPTEQLIGPLWPALYERIKATFPGSQDVLADASTKAEETAVTPELSYTHMVISPLQEPGPKDSEPSVAVPDAEPAPKAS